MSQLVSFNGVTYVIPDVADEDWGQNVTDFLVAIPAGALQKTGGAFTLTADVDFGTVHGLKSAFYAGRDTIIADAGTIRLSNTETMRWRNFANTGNNVLGTNTSDQLTYNGSPLEFNALAPAHIFVGNVSSIATDVAMTGDIGISNTGVTAIQSGVIVNAQINASAAIAYTKLNLSGSIINSDIFSSAGIAYSKLAAVTANRVLLSDASGFVSASTVTNTTLAFLDATSSIQTQLNAKQATGNYITALTGDVTASGPGSVASTLATVNANVGTFTAATITVNAKGLITAASSGSAGTGTVNSGTSTHLAYYATSTNAVSDASGATVSGTYTYSGAITHSATLTMSGATIAMGANKITGLANGTASTDAATFGQIFNGFQAPVFVNGVTSTTYTLAAFSTSVITASITPTSASHRVQITACFYVRTSSNVGQFTINRGASNLMGTSGGAQVGSPSVTNLDDAVTLTWIDSPATTSATTYTVFGQNAAASGNVLLGGNKTWTIMLEEIV